MLFSFFLLLLQMNLTKKNKVSIVVFMILLTLLYESYQTTGALSEVKKIKFNYYDFFGITLMLFISNIFVYFIPSVIKDFLYKKNTMNTIKLFAIILVILITPYFSYLIAIECYKELYSKNVISNIVYNIRKQQLLFTIVGNIIADFALAIISFEQEEIKIKQKNNENGSRENTRTFLGVDKKVSSNQGNGMF